jgi:hypothetical protein
LVYCFLPFHIPSTGKRKGERKREGEKERERERERENEKKERKRKCKLYVQKYKHMLWEARHNKTPKSRGTWNRKAGLR